MKKINIVLIIVIVAVVAAIVARGYFLYNRLSISQKQTASIIYKNDKYGFQITLPIKWASYTIVEQTWDGHEIDNYQKIYTGPELLIKNPTLATENKFQGIPVMVFTPGQWSLVSGNNPTVAVSAAPIGPGKIGENLKYIFATPPRYIGFADDLSLEQYNEVQNIVKTFKGF